MSSFLSRHCSILPALQSQLHQSSIGSYHPAFNFERKSVAPPCAFAAYRADVAIGQVHELHLVSSASTIFPGHSGQTQRHRSKSVACPES
jgi:hypothetical protein